VRVVGDQPMGFNRQFLWKDMVYEMRIPSRGFLPAPVRLREQQKARSVRDAAGERGSGDRQRPGIEVVERRSFPGRVMQFYHEVQDEMRKVTWPDRAQLKDTTIKIIIFVLFIGAVIGAIDLVLQLIFVQGLPNLFSRK